MCIPLSGSLRDSASEREQQAENTIRTGTPRVLDEQPKK